MLRTKHFKRFYSFLVAAVFCIEIEERGEEGESEGVRLCSLY